MKKPKRWSIANGKRWQKIWGSHESAFELDFFSHIGGSSLCALRRQQSQPAGQTRTYYIAADVVDWNFAPSGMDQIHGTKYDFKDDPVPKASWIRMPHLPQNPVSRIYRRQFSHLEPIPEAWSILAFWVR